MKVKILAEGGSMQPGPALSQKLGPLGIPINSVIQKVNEATKNFEGIKVPVELDINPSTKEFKILVFSPPVSELIKKELNLEKGSGQQANIQVANIPFERIVSIAKTKMPNLLCRDLKSSVKVVVGTCGSLGILIDNKFAKEIQKDIDNGEYEKQINEEITEVPEEKKKELEEYFDKIHKEQEKLIQQQEATKEEKTSEEEKK
jgi:large subunit ribosomal protein L11